MKLQPIVQQIEEAQARTDSLKTQVTTLPELPPLLQETFAELQAGLEELRVAEDELRQQNDELIASQMLIEAERQRYQDLFDFAPEAYLVTDINGLVREANTAAAALLGVSLRVLQGKPLASYMTQETRGEFRQRLLSLAAPAAESTQVTLALAPRGGGLVPAEASVIRISGVVEQPALLWAIHNLSERVEAEKVRAALAQADQQEKHLRAQSVLLDTMLTTAPTGFAFIGRDGTFLRANDAFARSTELRAEQIVGRRLDEIWGEANEALLRPRMEQAARGEAVPDTEIAYQAADGSMRHFSVAQYAVRDDKVLLGVGLVVADITGQKSAQSTLQSAYDREHRIAEVLQRSLLRTVPSETLAGLSVATFYEAALAEAQIGGDFFDVFTLDGGLVAFIVGDVSGKGLAAASSTAEIKYALRAFVRESFEPQAAMARLNNFMCDARNQGDWDDHVFATLALLVLNPQTGTGHLALAGAEPALVRRASGTVEAVEPRGMLLGIEPAQVYAQMKLTLLPGDTLLLATDGITEARRDRQFLGVDGLSALLADAGAQDTPQAVGDEVLRGVRRFVAGPEGTGSLSDDACLLVVRRQDTPPATTSTEALQ